jgi:hypothetical protein
VGIVDKQDRRSLRVAGAIGLLTVTVLGALSQGGVLIPRFRELGSGGVSGPTTESVVSEDIENVSPRSWTITGVHFTDPAAVRKLSDVRIVDLGVQPQNDLPNFSEHLSQRLTVSPGQYFDVTLQEKENDCPDRSLIPDPGQIQRLESSAQNHQRSIPATITVATPLGKRAIVTSLSLSCGL